MSQSSRPLGPSPHQRSRPLGPSPHPPPPPLLLIGEGGVISLTPSPEDRGRGFIKGGGGLTKRSAPQRTRHSNEGPIAGAGGAAIGTISRQPMQTHRRLVVASLMLAMFLSAMEVSIVATAMPSIVSRLGGFSEFTWVFSIFLLTQTATIPIYGKLADLYGRRPVFAVGTGI